MTKKHTRSWWKLIFTIWLLLFIFGSIWYYMGATSLRSKAGTSITIDRSADYNLYKINDSTAFYISGKYPNDVSLAKYAPAFPLFKIFGDYEYSGEFFGSSPLQSGDWLYVGTPNYYDKGRIVGYNIKTGETLIKQTPANPEEKLPPPEYTAKGLYTDSSYAVTVPYVLKNHPRLSVPPESAIVFFSGFIAAGILILILWPFARKKVQA